MEKVSIDFVKDKFSEIRKKDVVNFNTNYFLTPLDNEVMCLYNENAIVFLQPEYDFYRLYYVTLSFEALDVLFQKLPSDIKICVEIIKKGPLSDAEKQIFNQHFCFDTTFTRLRLNMKNIKRVKFCNSSDVEYAKENEVDFIYKNLHETFYQYSSHLPSYSQIKDHVKNNNVVVTRSTTGDISYFSLFIINESHFNFDQLVSLPCKNDEDLFTLLNYMYTAIRDNGATNGHLWVDEINNGNVVLLHKFYGYIPDGTKNHIFLSKALNDSKDDKETYLKIKTH